MKKLAVENPKNFKVTFDNFDIRRPILFPNPSAIGYGGPNPIIYPLSLDKTIAGRKLRCRGYIYVQKPHIDPVELQGVQIRIRGVGIGGFDRTWMGYPFDEGIKFGQITGEIYVTDGLESALNIDRASFRETDPHYMTIRAWLWSYLRETVFPEFKSRQDNFRKGKQEEAKQGTRRKLASVLESAPEAVGVTPRVEPTQRQSKLPFTKDNPKKEPSRERQSAVTVVEGEATVDKNTLTRITELNDIQIKGSARDRLLRVCAALAAYGIWDQLNATEAENLLAALAIAVES